GGYILIRGQIAQPPGLNQLWIPAQYQNRQNDTMTENSTIQGAIQKIDLSTYEHFIDNRVVLTAVYAHDANNNLLGDGWDAHIAGPIDIAFSADGATAYIVNAESNNILAFPTNITINRPAGFDPLVPAPVGDNPRGIVASPTSTRLFVFNY